MTKTNPRTDQTRYTHSPHAIYSQALKYLQEYKELLQELDKHTKTKTPALQQKLALLIERIERAQYLTPQLAQHTIHSEDASQLAQLLAILINNGGPNSNNIHAYENETPQPHIDITIDKKDWRLHLEHFPQINEPPEHQTTQPHYDPGDQPSTA
jgi:hypothetical protein